MSNDVSCCCCNLLPRQHTRLLLIYSSMYSGDGNKFHYVLVSYIPPCEGIWHIGVGINLCTTNFAFFFVDFHSTSLHTHTHTHIHTRLSQLLILLAMDLSGQPLKHLQHSTHTTTVRMSHRCYQFLHFKAGSRCWTLVHSYFLLNVNSCFLFE